MSENSKSNYKLLLICVGICMCVLLCAPEEKNDDSEKFKKSPPVKTHELMGQTYEDWDKIEKDWYKAAYGSCMKKFNLKMNCGSCEYIYIKGLLTVDQNLRFSSFKPTKGNICGNPAPKKIQECFIKYFRKKKFPESLKNRTIEVMLGTGLGC